MHCTNHDQLISIILIKFYRPPGSESILGNKWFGIDIQSEDLADNMESCVWEPAIVKINAITAASEAACLILSVDETVKNPKSQGGDGGAGGRPF